MVPCSRITRIFDPRLARNVMLTTREEEAIALACGLLLAGAHPLAMMQASGAANSLNSIGGLAVAYRLPLVALVSLRGEDSDPNRTHVPVRTAIGAALENMGCNVIEAAGTSALETSIHQASVLAPLERRPQAVLYQEVSDARA